MPTLVNSEDCVGGNAPPAERLYVMSENDPTPKNSAPTSPDLKSGEEPTELLLRLVWSAVETLAKRNEANVFVGRNAVIIMLPNTGYDEKIGLAPTERESVGAKAPEPTQA